MSTDGSDELVVELMPAEFRAVCTSKQPFLFVDRKHLTALHRPEPIILLVEVNEGKATGDEEYVLATCTVIMPTTLLVGIETPAHARAISSLEAIEEWLKEVPKPPYA